MIVVDTNVLSGATIVADRRTAGRPVGQVDAMIAGTARSRGVASATRNLRDLERCGVVLIDPWP